MTNGDGSAGGNSSWSDGTNTVVGNGGDGGTTASGKGAGGSGSGGDLTIPGQYGHGGRYGGGDSVLGHGGQGGKAGEVYGGGGSGSGDFGSTAYAGADGIVIVTEFY